MWYCEKITQVSQYKLQKLIMPGVLYNLVKFHHYGYFLEFLLFSLKNHNSEVSPLIPKCLRLVHSGIISQQPVQIWNVSTEYKWTYSIFHKHISNDAKWRSNFGAKKTNNAFITEFPDFYFEGYFCEFYQPAKFHQNQ